MGAIPRYLLERQEELGVFVPNIIRKCVAFVGIARDDGSFTPTATGFFAHAGEGSLQRTHFVTAEHVVTLTKEKIERDRYEKSVNGKLAVRLNIKGGGSEVVPLDDVHWWSHPDLNNLTDVAVTPCSFGKDYFDHFPLPLWGSVVNSSTTAHLKRRGAALGQEIAIIGLFRHHRGAERNEPLVRVGNIAAMPEERVWTKYCSYTEGYLVEAHSIGGLSGSPVFLNLTYSPPMTLNIGGVTYEFGEDGKIDFHQYPLFGLMHGHWDIPNMTDEVVTEDIDGQRESINAGVGVVIPVQKIIETLYQPELVEMRKKLEDEMRKEGATPDIADDEGRPSTELHPKGRERFNSLLGEAARKREQED